MTEKVQIMLDVDELPFEVLFNYDKGNPATRQQPEAYPDLEIVSIGMDRATYAKLVYMAAEKLLKMRGCHGLSDTI